MKILNRYIFREAAFFFAVSLLVFTGILLTLRMLKFTSLVINRGVELSQIGMLFVAIIPTFLEIAIPLSALLGVMLAMGRLSGDSEIIVMRSSGISLFALVKPIAIFGALVAAGTFMITIYLSPAGFQSMSRTLFEIARSQSLAGMEPGVFNKLGQLTLYAEQIDYENSGLTHVLIDDKRSEQARRIINSNSGTILSDAENKNIIFALNDGYIHEMIEGKYVLTHFEKNSLILNPSQMYDPEQVKHGPNPRELTLTGLAQRREQLSDVLTRATSAETPLDEIKEKLRIYAPDLLRSDKQETVPELEKKLARMDTETNRRFSMPFAAMILALLGLPLGIQVPRTQRTWGIGICAALGMFVFVIYYALFSIGVGMAEGGSLPAWVALWVPNLVAFAITAYSINSIGSERWESIPHAVEEFIQAILKRVRPKEVLA